MRSGVIAQKVGMTRVFTDAGEHVPVTVLRSPAARSSAIAPRTRTATSRCSSAPARRKAKNIEARPSAAISPRPRSSPSASSPNSASTDDALIPVGAEITADHFVAGQFVDVTGTSIGKGFAGGMKRWNFGGLRATHGVSISHRSIGSTGGRQDPGKTFKNKKMPGQWASSASPRSISSRADRCRARPDPGRRRGAGRQGRLDHGARRREEGAAEGSAEARQVPRGEARQGRGRSRRLPKAAARPRQEGA